MNKEKKNNKMKKVFRVCNFITMVGCVLALASCASNEPVTTTAAAHTHSYGEWTTITKATCQIKGLESRICSCGEIETRILEKTDHNVIPGVPVAATCEKSGKTAGERCSVCNKTLEEGQIVLATGHDWADATCMSPKKCKNCSKVEGSALEHTVVVDNEVKATCTTSGKTKGEHCSVCGRALIVQAEVKPLGHDYKETVLVRVTCEKNGKSTYKCSRCGDSYTKDLSATGHNWKNATCTSAKKCANCGKTSGSALGHNYSNGKCTRCNQEEPQRLTKIFCISGMHNNYMHIGMEFVKNNYADVRGYIFYVDVYKPNGSYYASATYTILNDSDERIAKLLCLGRGDYNKYVARISQID